MAESHLQSPLITASQFFEIWLHFDADGSGYLEGKELQNLIHELQQARKKAGLELSPEMKTFVDQYGQRDDGKIGIVEVRNIFLTRFSAAVTKSPAPTGTCGVLSQSPVSHSRDVDLLQAEAELHAVPATGRHREPALSPERQTSLETSSKAFLMSALGTSSSPRASAELSASDTDFNFPAEMTWRKYDTDHSGFIETEELKNFLKDLLEKANKAVDDAKLAEYTDLMLKLFDSNNDGKLELTEMARLLPVQENFLLKFQGVKMCGKEFNKAFELYDQDGNGYIDENELDALLKDLCEKNKQDLDTNNIPTYKKSIMALSDGGKLYRTDLALILCAEDN
ncbi:calbindin [Pteropus vampyrus]|uniref:Calbindin n=1 Tax=Pteropus vampyrus TaxID=132908 RepID=A0A6P3RME4_PTEVA|nr:calbindin [Pteropus vampyrus]